jgi:YfiH family protein
LKSGHAESSSAPRAVVCTQPERGTKAVAAYHRPMLVREVCSNGPILFKSSLLEAAKIPHAFSTRLGGVSRGPFASLNFGNPAGITEPDPRHNILENFGRVLNAIGCAERSILQIHQVHGPNVVAIGSGGIHDDAAKADAIVLTDPSRIAAVRVADCAPVLIASADGRAVAAVHAGWRGVIAGVVPAAIAELRRATAVGDLIAAIGPCIGVEAFEVGPEVVADFDRVFGSAAPVRRRDDGKGHVDLKAAIFRQLRDARVRRVDTSDRCTVRDADEFFSHRRDQGATGRMAAVIGPRWRTH